MGLRDWGLDKATGWIGRKTQGCKTKAGGIGLIILGIVGILGHIWTDAGLPVQEWDTIFGEIGAGLAALGIGSKIERVKAAVQENTEITKVNAPVKGLLPEAEEKKWDGKIPGQFP